MTARTLYDKLWDDHVVHTEDDGTAVLYIDRHLVHEVTSPQAFDGLRHAHHRPVRRADLTLATEDHNVPTIDIDKPIADPVSAAQVDALTAQLLPAPLQGQHTREVLRSLGYSDADIDRLDAQGVCASA